MSMLSVMLPDGSSRELAQGATALDLAKSIGSGLAKAAVAAVVVFVVVWGSDKVGCTCAVGC